MDDNLFDSRMFLQWVVLKLYAAYPTNTNSCMNFCIRKNELTVEISHLQVAIVCPSVYYIVSPLLAKQLARDVIRLRSCTCASTVRGRSSARPC